MTLLKIRSGLQMFVATMMCNATVTEIELYDAALAAFGQDLSEANFLRLLKLLEGVGLLLRDPVAKTVELTDLGRRFANDLNAHAAMH